MTTQNESDSSSDTQDTSTDTTLEVEFASAETTISDASEQAAPSTATEGAKPANLLELVKSVVAGTQAKASPAEETAEKPESQATEGTPKPGDPASSDAPDATGEAKPEDDEKLPFHKHPRWQSVIRERNELKEQIAPLQDKAGQFEAISDYMAEQRLTPPEVNDGFIIMAALKNDPAKALELLTPIFQRLQSTVGETLPDDVAKMVDDGELSDTAAKELARARAQVAIQENRQREEFAYQQQQADANSHQQIVGAVETWEKQVATRDPDYQAKRHLVLQNIKLANLSKPATNAQEAVAIAEAALAKATETARGFQPRKVTVKQPNSDQSVSHAKPVPKNLGDVVRQALSNA